MSSLGKIFIYEQNFHNFKQYANHLEAQGFLTFGTDNLYLFLKYSEQINPDIVIMNLPEKFNANEQTWQTIENSLCKQSCPQIFINSQRKFSHQPAFHYYDFKTKDVLEEQIIDILRHTPKQQFH